MDGGEAAVLPDRSDVSDESWAAYASTRPHVASDARTEAAAHLIRHREAIVQDAWRKMGLDSADKVEEPLRALAWLLAGAADGDARATAITTRGLDGLAAHLDERVCVPRDLGAPVAAALTGILASRGEHVAGV